ncbi:hypothetical protein SUGI_1519770 [Cryptomeria japonica]|uniref:Uncharacterized protein n=1 Tax=Cryptomeria japonica TaxID=3369 RepID=A0AAD3NU77_CRYJA|nr:hypothetical protein SUGI_1503170 [Cryptomeria japonica]GLJ59653.1 hypothetical protein SUGI_1517800 [Cryptomeria japonica]GLJ59709.1 hypothetical protein SUGI_1519770 [Cryptomeria japonica]
MPEGSTTGVSARTPLRIVGHWSEILHKMRVSDSTGEPESNSGTTESTATSTYAATKMLDLLERVGYKCQFDLHPGINVRLLEYGTTPASATPTFASVSAGRYAPSAPAPGSTALGTTHGSGETRQATDSTIGGGSVSMA